ncbi:MAG: phosphatidylserine decarboxylase family protein [Candidatus Edwardsbacteria bacterium]|jgi:phosphatidylserine decarboxylase|nr:phosphatidylserine decarboxylase family protein [Candidatus Edwardsbacteria bacterium]
MRIAPEGTPEIALSLGLALVFGVLALAFHLRWAALLSAACGLAGLCFCCFFRDPQRAAPPDPLALLAPADGRVVIVREVDEPFFIGGRARQVSIFMSPLDVHINRIPLDGTVEYKRYYPGRYLPAFRDKASTDNEQTHLGIAAPQGKVLVKQIAGALARRVVCHPAPGDRVARGQRYGLIKLGSRLDLFFPPEWEVNVGLEQRVRGGLTTIARISEP